MPIYLLSPSTILVVEVIIKLKNMIDDKKMETAKEEIYEDKFLGCGEMVEAFEDEDKMEMFDKEDIKEAIGLGAKWMQEEFLKDLRHPASEVPRNDNGKVLAFSKEIGHRKLYDMNAMLDEIDCGDYQEMWEFEVKAYRWTNWIFIEELFDMIRKGGKK